MNQETQNITCPSCGVVIDVNDILYHQLDAEIKKKYQDELTREKTKFAEQQSELEAKRKELEADKAKLDEQIEERVKAGVKQQNKAFEK